MAELAHRPAEELEPRLPDPLPPDAAAGSIVWTRRRQALRRAWLEYRRSAMGMVGLAILVLFVVLAVAAPLLAPSRELDVTRATGVPLAPPGDGSPWAPTRTAARCSP